MTVPDVLPDLNVIVPVPLVGGPLNVRVILVVIATAVAALAGTIEFKVSGTVVKL
jgi:hypothetical protein